MSGATVTAYIINADGSNGSILGSGTTDAQGNFSISFDPVPAGTPVRLAVKGGSFQDEATGSIVAVSEAFDALVVNLPDVQGNASGVQLTPLTTFADGLAAAKLAGGTALATAIGQAHTEVAERFGIAGGITTVDPVFTTSSPSTDASPGFLSGLLFSALCEEAKTLRANAAFSSVTAADLVQALREDLKDGVFDGKGSGGSSVPLGTATLPSSAGSGDLTKALVDFVTTGAGSSLGVSGTSPSVSTVIESMGTPISLGAATNLAVGTWPTFVAIGDLNGDGKPDLATANGVNDNVSILLGNGTGSFGTATNFPVGDDPVCVAIGDLNADGKPDLAAANYLSNTVSILLGTGTGSFGAATNFVVGSFPFSVAVADFDRDGDLDLAVANGGSNTVSVLLNQ